MTSRTLILTTSLAAVIVAVVFVATDHALAAEPHIAGTQVISSDATAQFVPLELGKFIIIDLPRDAKDVMIANPATANVVMRTARQATILGMANGHTNIAFYDVNLRQIEALDITVQSYPIKAIPTGSANVVTVYSGGWHFLSCTRTNTLSEGAACYSREDPAGNLNDLPHGSIVSMPVGK